LSTKKKQINVLCPKFVKGATKKIYNLFMSHIDLKRKKM